MNGYWDAVLGAALGGAGTARPSAPPLFAGDDGAGFVEMDSETEAPALVAPPTAEPRRSLPPAPALESPPGMPLAEAPLALRAGHEPSPEPEATRAAERDAEPPPQEPARSATISETVAEASSFRGAADAPPQVAPPPTQMAAPAVEPSRPDPPAIAAETVVAPASPEQRRAEIAAPILDVVPERAPIPAEPITPLAELVEVTEVVEAAPPLVIEIGRIDVRILSPEPARAPPPRQRASNGDVPSLADYLARRSEAGR